MTRSVVAIQRYFLSNEQTQLTDETEYPPITLAVPRNPGMIMWSIGVEGSWSKPAESGAGYRSTLLVGIVR